MRFLNRFFSPSVPFKTKFEFNGPEMKEIIKSNRQSLSQINNWIDEEAFKKSFFSYGVPDFIKNDINKPIGNDVTYTDLMVYIFNKYFSQINYLEIGVSVGKNFFQLINAYPKGVFTGFDIEEINPVLGNKMTMHSQNSWKTPANSIKKTDSSFKKYKFDNTAVSYLNGDVWDENTWSKLAGNKFNVVFSDALHTPQAILFEFEMLVKYDLLDQKFIIVWDDLVGKMRNSFFKIIRKYDKVYNIQDIYLLNINGWVGEHESPHSVGIISNFRI